MKVFSTCTLNISLSSSVWSIAGMGGGVGKGLRIIGERFKGKVGVVGVVWEVGVVLGLVFVVGMVGVVGVAGVEIV